VGSQRRILEAGGELQVALNTIPRPHERSKLLQQIPALLDLGIRTLIVNDIGILAGLRRRFPGLRLTASIGCGAQTVGDAVVFRDLGATAVVLPGTLGPMEVREIATVRGILIEVMLHMVEEFVLLGKCSMPSYVHLKPSPMAIDPSAGPAPRSLRQTGSMKRGGVGACFKICQQSWELFDGDRRVDERSFPSRQLSRAADVHAYVEAGVGVLKLQGRSLPPDQLASLVRRYRKVLDGAASGPWSADQVSLPAAWTVVGR
jgi:putative protease